MRFLLQITVLCWCTFLFAQGADDTSVRAKSGDLTYEECMSLVSSDRILEAVPSLNKLRNRLEQRETYDAERYYSVVMALYVNYIKKGDIYSARNLINDAGTVCSKRESSPNNEYTRRLLCCRGQLENMLKNYDEALRYFAIANKYFQEANDLGEQYMVLLNNMGIAYLMTGDLESSKSYMDKMKETFERLYGSFTENLDDDQYLFLAYYGLMLQSIGKESDAEEYYLNVINNCKRTTFSYDAYLLSANNLSMMYSRQGKWAESLKLLEELKGSNSLSNYVIWQNLAIGYIHTNQSQKAISALAYMNDCFLSNIEQLYSNFTGMERERSWDEMANSNINVNNLIAYRTNDSQAIRMAYNNILLSKNMSIKASRFIEEYISGTGNPTLLGLYNEYKANKSTFNFKNLSFETRDSLRRAINLSERRILGYTNNLGRWIKNISKTWENVKAMLKEGEIAIEYCHLPNNKTYPISEFRYGAFILRPDYEYPIFVALDDIKAVNQLFYYSDSDALFINDIYASEKNIKLFKLLWEPLKEHLNGIQKVYYSPTGPLSDLNFEVLRGEDGMMLNDKYKMIRVSSTANIAEVKAGNIDVHTSVLYGNIDYDESEEEMRNASIAYHSFSGTEIQSELALRSLTERGAWGGLPSTKKEIDYIHSLLTKQGVKVAKLEESNANEESFKSLGGKSPELIHLATHGFVIDTKKKAEGNKFVASTSVYSNKDSYMMWSGLMLAGGNNIWRGNFNQSNVEDGILTADEISRMDLSNTKLVVLSACETAKGKVDPVDGVYGLQRAFKMAGVGTIVMSLWKVQDDATSMLMTQFYTYLTSGVEKHQALWKAMMDVRAKYKDPYYWAGFVMLD